VRSALWLGLALGLFGNPTPPETAILATWSDAHELVSNRSDVRAEIGSILEGAGIRLHWTDEISREAPAGSLPVVVVVSPSEPAGAGWHLPPSAMGVYLGSGSESSAIFVFYRRVAGVLGVGSGCCGMMEPSDRKRLARALARVVVHELVHRVAPDLPHADTGLMRSDLGRSQLLRSRLPLDERSARAVLAALRETRRVDTANHLSAGPRTK
jgi:hypothetical protein